MNLKDFFRNTDKRNVKQKKTSKPSVPDGLFAKCKRCGETILAEDFENNCSVCPSCNYHAPINSKDRLKLTVDEGSFFRWDFGVKTDNVLGIEGYDSKLKVMREKTELYDAIISGSARIGKIKCAIAVMDSRFMMASMGYYVGEHLRRTIERATERRLPLVVFTASGGARMQEGIVSLMQMAKTSGALKKHHEAGLLYVTCITHPTTGGVTASFASLGDIILSEPEALIGFAGRRVIESTIKQQLPDDFQLAEFQLENGFIDKIVDRKDLKETLNKILVLHKNKNQSLDFKLKKPKKIKQSKKQKTPWDIVKLARDKERPVATDYIEKLFDDFIEFHGDRLFKDDSAVVGGIAKFNGKPVTVIGQAKGTDIKSNMDRNFGMMHPHGYRKALRLMKQAEKFNRPIVCIVDTPGAYCGISAEEGGQGQAIAENLFEMSGLEVPVLTIIIGEAGSGGALGLAVSNEVWMMENSIYSILSPEGYASILWKDGTLAEKAAKEMKLTANDMKALGIIEEIIPEPEIFTRNKLDAVSSVIENKIEKFFEKYNELDKQQIVQNRYSRFSKM